MNVLVVDDESIMREAFSRLFAWEEYGLNQIGQAKNGKEALEMIQEQDVNIVVTDLKMPVMDGLTLIAEARKVKPQVKFVVMSAYDTFDLVSEAYKLGVKDYFLKFDMDPEKVLTMLQRLSEEIREECKQAKNQKEQWDKLQRIEAVMTENEQVLREQVMRKLLFSGKNDAALAKQLEGSDLSLSPHKLRLMILCFDNYYELEKQEWQDERELLKFGILNVIEEILKSFGDVYAFCNLPHEYVLLYSEENTGQEEGFAAGLFSVLKKRLAECFGFLVSAGISDLADGFAQGLTLYQQAKNACEHAFVKGRGHLISQQDIKGKTIAVGINLHTKAEDFKKMLPKLRDSEQVHNCVESFSVSSGRILPEQATQVRELFYTYYYEILSYIKQNNLKDRKNLCEQTEYFNHKLHDEGTLPELNEWLACTLNMLAQEIDQADFVFSAKRYINLNYSKDISLGDVAEHLGISESYLSRLFKRETGDSFSEYLLQVRIAKAEELMRMQRYKVYEIAEQVGYRNVEYFSRQFKKITGKSPSEY